MSAVTGTEIEEAMVVEALQQCGPNDLLDLLANSPIFASPPTVAADCRTLVSSAPSWQFYAVQRIEAVLAETPGAFPSVMTVVRRRGVALMAWVMPAWCLLTPEQQEACVRNLPPTGRAPAIIELEVDVARAQIRAAGTDKAKRGAALQRLGFALADSIHSADKEEAVVVTQESVDIRRELVQASPGLHEADLAQSLNSLAMRLVGVGRSNAGESAARESVELRERLVGEKKEPAFKLAQSLDTLARILSRVSKDEEAIQATQKACAIFDELYKMSPASHTVDVAVAYTGLANRLHDALRFEEAANAAIEAIRVCRLGQQGGVANIDPHLACALRIYAESLYDLGREQEAMIAINESVTIRYSLATAKPNVYSGVLAVSLSTLSQITFDRVQAHTAAVKSLETLLAIGDEDSDLATAHWALARSLLGDDEQNRQDALTHVAKAVAIQRRIAEVNPKGRFALAKSLALWAMLLTCSTVDEELDLGAKYARESNSIAETLPVARQLLFGKEVGLLKERANPSIRATIESI